MNNNKNSGASLKHCSAIYNNHELLDIMNKCLNNDSGPKSPEDEITERYYIKYINIRYNKNFKNFKELLKSLE